MDNKISNIKERILHFANNQGVSYERFSESIGMTYGNFKGDNKKRPINSDALDKLLTNYPEVSPEWLLTGSGEMLKKNAVISVVAEDQTSHNISKGIPLLPFDAFAGVGESSVIGVDFEKIEERYDVPLFYDMKVDFMIYVRGSSMYPKYSSGDVVACRLIEELLFVQWNKIYVLDTISQGIIMKRLIKSESEGNVICKSDNKEYGEFEVPMVDIRKIALVVGSIRLE